MATIKLSDAEVLQKLADLNADTRRSWQLVDGKLKKQFEFGSFILAFAFMTKVAMLAETLNHHPEWSNVYGRVVIELITHEINAISERDFILALRIEAMAV
ncbi:MAG: 4a-hydroxytetrahydrobiopterin dehydratase [Agitococcus sp.]|nr:4a-hydroxytetrahydrobiopterin dehydratase [Agitococcus sp.]